MRERERERRMQARVGQREKVAKDPKVGSSLTAESSTRGLNSRTGEIMTWAEVGLWTDWATQVPQGFFLYPACQSLTRWMIYKYAPILLICPPIISCLIVIHIYIKTKAFNLGVIDFSILLFLLLGNVHVLSKKAFSNSSSWRGTLVTSKSFRDLRISFRSVIHFELTFAYGPKKGYKFTLLSGGVQWLLYHLLKRLSFRPLNFPGTQCISGISAFFKKNKKQKPKPKLFWCLHFVFPKPQVTNQPSSPGALQGNIVWWKKHLLLVGQTYLDLLSNSIFMAVWPNLPEMSLNFSEAHPSIWEMWTVLGCQ